MANLPLDIIADILSRMAVKDLLCFRCVSKPWCKLIDGPDFIKLHLDTSIKASTNQTLILIHADLYLVSMDSLNSASKLEHPLMCYNHSVKTLGSCNGFVCICNIVDDIAIWNPSTRKHKVLPYLSVDLNRYSGACVCSVCVFGLGYDMIHDDYKFVRIAQFCGVETKFFECEVKIYSLEKNTWRRIRDMPHMLRYPGANGVFVNGALHWVVSRDVRVPEFNIVIALDLGIEEYKEVVLPEFGDMGFRLEVGVLGGCLSVVANYRGVRSDVWVMKDYGVKDSWIKLCSIADGQVVGRLRYTRPLCYSNGGREVMFEQDRTNLIMYDLKSKTVKDVRIRGTPISYEVEACMRSLVSLTVRRRNYRKKIKEDKNVKKRDDFLSYGFKLVL